MKFGQVAADYIREKPNMNASTFSNVHRLIRTFGPVQIKSLTSEMVRQYIVDRRHDGAAAATTNRELTILKQICKRAEERGLVHSDASRGVPFEKGAVQRTRWLTRDEECSLLERSPGWLANIVAFDLETGLRRGELLDLTWENVNLATKTIEITRTKNGVPRVIPLSGRATAILTRLGPGVGAVFRREGRQISPSELEYFFKLAREKAGIQDLHFHDLRHTFATRLAQRGVELYAIQRLLGHKTIAMSARYSHHNVESLRKAMEIS